VITKVGGVPAAEFSAPGPAGRAPPGAGRCPDPASLGEPGQAARYRGVEQGLQAAVAGAVGAAHRTHEPTIFCL